MRCETTNDVEEFWTRAHAWLAAEPVLNSVFLTNVLRYREWGTTDHGPATYAIVYATGERESGGASDSSVGPRSHAGRRDVGRRDAGRGDAGLQDAGQGDTGDVPDTGEVRSRPTPLDADGRGGIVGVAMRTPPFHTYVSTMPADAIEPLTDALLEACPDNDGVTGTAAEAEAVARAWARRTGCAIRPVMRQRLHSLETVIPARPAPGEIRLARREERDLLISWRKAFDVEVDHGRRAPGADVSRPVDDALAEDRAFVWDDHGPVCYVGITPTIAGVARVAPVYTPPEQRGRGYASAAVAGVSQGVLDAGASRCCLYTDLANPTSNKIYAAVGYRPVADIAVIKFGPPESAGPAT